MPSLLHLLPSLDAIRLGWALVHFIWQGLVVAFLLEIALAVTGNRNASLRYVLCSFALVSMPVCLVSTYLRLGQESTATFLASPSVMLPHESMPHLVPSLHFTLQPMVQTITDFTSLGILAFDLNRWLPSLVMAWLVGVALLSLRKAGGLIVLGRWQRIEVYAPDEAMCELCRRACATIGVDPRRIYLGISNLIEVPMTMGWIRPVILFPANLLTGLSVEQIELLLAHELAHIRRCDYVVNLIQTMVETVFFYHPVTWWISRRMRQERENCCDDMVTSRSQEVVAYAHALFRIEELRLSGDFGLATAANGGSLLQRIERLADEPLRKSRGRTFFVLAIMCVVAALLATGVRRESAEFSSLGFLDRSGGTFASPSSTFGSIPLDETVYQDNFGRTGELDGSSPGVVDKTGALWKSSTGGNQYRTSGHAAEIRATAYAYSLAYLPVNGTSGVKLTGREDFTLSVAVNPGPTGRTGISLNTGTMMPYSNLFTHCFAALTTCNSFAGAFTFNDDKGTNIQYSYAAGAHGPTQVSLSYSASSGTLTYKVGDTNVHVQTGVRPEQVADIRYIGLGNDGFNSGAVTAAPGATPAVPAFANFTFTVRGSADSSSALASTR